MFTDLNSALKNASDPLSTLLTLLFQVTSRRMSQFNEGEQAREERKKYQKTAQVLTLFILSYIAQWWAWIVFCLWSFFGEASAIIVRSFGTLKLLKSHNF